MNSSSFYLNCPLGLESLCLDELKLKAKSLNVELIDIAVKDGGIDFKAELVSLRKLIPYLKTPNRLLMNIQSFKCRDLPKLFQKIQKIKWNQYLLNGEFELLVTASSSRLNNEKRIKQSVSEAIEKYLSAQPAKKLKKCYQHKIKINFKDDLCNIGIDLVGEHLHKRSKREQLEAPLRETYAASMFFLAYKEQKTALTSLLDPMCGSGTFAFESINFFSPSKREFSINFLREFAHEPALKLEELEPTVLERIECNDLSDKATEVAKENISKLSNLSTENFKYSNIDILSAEPNMEKSDLVLCNPPYGERLPFSSKNYSKLGENLGKLSNKAIVCLLPKSDVKCFEEKLCYKAKRSFPFKNGGISLCLNLYSINN